MSTANRLRKFRQLKRMTQEDLAAEWGVTVRSIRRWERGEGRPAEWMRRQLASVGSPLDWPGVTIIRELIERRDTPAMIYDSSLSVLAAGQAHRQWFYEQHRSDVVGVDWRRFMEPRVTEMLQSLGGMPYLIRNGLMCLRGLYADPGGQDGSFIPRLMFIDATVVRLPDYGDLCVTVARAPHPGESLDPLAPFFMD